MWDPETGKPEEVDGIFDWIASYRWLKSTGETETADALERQIAAASAADVSGRHWFLARTVIEPGSAAAATLGTEPLFRVYR